MGGSSSGIGHASFGSAIVGPAKLGEAACRLLREVTDLLSPKKEALSGLTSGQVLRIGVAGAVVVAFSGKHIVGSIDPVVAQKLEQCMNLGVEYEAEIVLIRGGIVRVEVRATRK